MEALMLCETCKFWDQLKGEKAGFCLSEFMEYANRPKAGGLSYMDAEQYSVLVRTAPDFGCIHWEAKE